MNTTCLVIAGFALVNAARLWWQGRRLATVRFTNTHEAPRRVRGTRKITITL